MNLFTKILILVYALLTVFGCVKDWEQEGVVVGQTSLLENASINEYSMAGCDDSMAFKSMVDLESLSFLQDCYSCSAIKKVPGLGEIEWKGNCEVYDIESDTSNLLTIRFLSYVPFFNQLHVREEFIGGLPNVTGIHIIHSYSQWLQNPSLNFGSYSRLLADGDVLDALWEIDTTCTNLIEVTQVNLEDQEIQGNFELHLKMVSQGTHGILYSERINFLNGTFYARIRKV